MYKRSITFVLSVIMCLTCSACKDFVDKIFDKTCDIYSENSSCPVKFVEGQGEEYGHYVYNNKKYIYDNELFYQAGGIVNNQKNNFVQIGEELLEVYYSYTTDNPMYIISSSKGDFVYLRSDYVLIEDTFTISNTDISFVLSEVIKENHTIEYDRTINHKYVSLEPHSLPYLSIGAYIFQNKGKFYISINGWNNVVCEITDEFSQLLIDNNFV